MNRASIRLGRTTSSRIGLRTRLGAAVEQRLVGALGPDVEIDLAMIFDIRNDPVAVPEGVVPAVIEGRAETAEARIEEAPAIKTAVAVGSDERIGDDADLAVVDAVAELHEHARARRIGRGRVAARGQLLRDDCGIALEFEAATRGHATDRNDRGRSVLAAPASPGSA